MTEGNTIKEILNSTAHRPWEMPPGNWKFYQEWNNLVFLHWQVELDELKKFVPAELEIDLFEGAPWVSLVAFTMERIRPRNLPPFPPVSNFDEINIRTYVKSNNKTGVYFLSIEGGTAASCKIAKGISELPYRYSKMKRRNGLFESSNTKYADRLKVEFQIGDPLKNKAALDLWLTERYALFQDAGQAINEFEIHHLEWPVHSIDLKLVDLQYSRFENLISNTPDHMHYSPGVKVMSWGKEKRDKASFARM